MLVARAGLHPFSGEHMSYAPSQIQLMLHAIRDRSDASQLLAAGLSYSQIAQLIARVRELGLVEQKELRLSASGESALVEVAETRPRNSEWVQAAIRHRTPLADRWAVYLPEEDPQCRLARPLGDTRNYIRPLASGG